MSASINQAQVRVKQRRRREREAGASGNALLLWQGRGEREREREKKGNEENQKSDELMLPMMLRWATRMLTGIAIHTHTHTFFKSVNNPMAVVFVRTGSFPDFFDMLVCLCHFVCVILSVSVCLFVRIARSVGGVLPFISRPFQRTTYTSHLTFESERHNKAPRYFGHQKKATAAELHFVR